MNKSEIATKIKETEEQLASLRAKLEEPEYPTLADAKPGDKLKNGCVVVHKFSDFRMALIAAPQSTERSCRWDKEFKEVFDSLSQEGFNKSQWFIPNVKQLQLAYKNCKEHLAAVCYWSSIEDSPTNSWLVSFNVGRHYTGSKTIPNCVRAFSLVSY
jgi:hypothetical protein